MKHDHWSAGFCNWSDPWTMSESFICLYLWCMVVSTGNFVSCSFLSSQNVILVILDCRVRAYWCFGQPTLTYFLTLEVLYHFTVYLYTYSRTSSHSKPWPGTGNNLGFSMSSKTSLFFACLYNWIPYSGKSCYIRHKTGQTQCFSIDPPSLERRFSSQKRPLPSGEEWFIIR